MNYALMIVFPEDKLVDDPISTAVMLMREYSNLAKRNKYGSTYEDVLNKYQEGIIKAQATLNLCNGTYQVRFSSKNHFDMKGLSKAYDKYHHCHQFATYPGMEVIQHRLGFTERDWRGGY